MSWTPNHRYVFWIDGKERPTLEVQRPSIDDRPVPLIFELDNESFPINATATPGPPALNLTLADPTYDDGSGASWPHPFVITDIEGHGTQNAYALGMLNNGAKEGLITMELKSSAPDVLFYESGNTAGMGGRISVTDSVLGPAKLTPYRRLLYTAQEEEAAVAR